MTLRLLTYNIRNGGAGRVDSLARVIGSCAPDLVVMQEATRPEVVAALAGRLGMADWRGRAGHSLACLSREPLAHVAWHRPRFSRHACIEIVPAAGAVRIFGVHLSAIHAAWTERRRQFELRALLHGIRQHQNGFHVVAGDFNSLAPEESLDVGRLPARYRPFVWLSGGRIRWRTIQTLIDAGYVDVYRRHHRLEPGHTLPTWDPHVRLDYMFVPAAFGDAMTLCDVVQHPDAAVASDHFPVVAEVRL
ncbi:MAG: endonuclease/exonuclease/phosphatase family protein [Acidobacteriota bacterium]